MHVSQTSDGWPNKLAMARASKTWGTRPQEHGSGGGERSAAAQKREGGTRIIIMVTKNKKKFKKCNIV